MYFLKSNRIGFRKWKSEDLPYAQMLWGDPKVMEYIDTRKQLSELEIKEKLHEEILREKEFGVQYWPIFLLESNTFLGCSGLRPYNLFDSTYETGVHLCAEFWKKGYAEEALRKVIEYAFFHLEIQTLFAGHNPNNLSSAQLLKKIGFYYWKDEFYEPTGLYHPSYLLKKGDVFQDK